MSTTRPTDLDKVAYDAPLPFTPPSKAWVEAMGGRANNQTSTLVYGEHVPVVDLRGKWVIISGSNSGIGREAALTMSTWGANLILACREPPKDSHETHPINVVEQCQVNAFLLGIDSTIEWWEIDMTDLESVEEFAERWLETGRPLDVLCNNAGVGSSPSTDKEVFKTKDGFEFIHQINFLSHVLLTVMLLPSLAKAQAPRVVCTTSCFHYLGHFDISNFNGKIGEAGSEGVQYYKNNKLYFQIWLNELQRRLLCHEDYKHITVNGFHPGYVASGIWRVQRQFWLRWLLVWILSTVARFFGIDEKQGSMSLVYLATAPECGPKLDNEGSKGTLANGGRYFNRIWEEDGMPHCKDPDLRSRVWRKAAEELRLAERGFLDMLGLYGARDTLLN